MLMGIDICYPDFEEEYWNNKEEHKVIHDGMNKWRGAIIAETRKAKELKKERDILKTENKNLQSNYDALCNHLEQKYWEAQRTIDKYAAENEELKKSKKDLTRWRDMYYDLQKERDELENKLLDTENKLEETERELKGTKRYLEGYQSLYIEEVLKHKESDDRDEDKALDIYDLEDGNGEDDDNKS